MSATAVPSAGPKVSVVVPTGHGVDLLDRCVDALLGQTMPVRDFEILIIDEHGTHQTQQLVAMWSARALARGLAIRYVVSSSDRGAAAARNLGVHQARAPVIAFTDERAVPEPAWLMQGLERITLGADVVCGCVQAPVPARPTDYQRDAARLETLEFATVNCFIRKSVLESVGGFDEHFDRATHQDNDLYFRLLDIGAKFVRAPQAIVIYPVHPAPWGVCLAQSRTLLFDALLYKKHPERYRQQEQDAPRWHAYRLDYAIVAALLAFAAALAAGVYTAAALAALVWLVLTSMLCARRLKGTSHRLSHVAEVVLTSALLSPVAVFWRLAGAVRYRVKFA